MDVFFPTTQESRLQGVPTFEHLIRQFIFMLLKSGEYGLCYLESVLKEAEHSDQHHERVAVFNVHEHQGHKYEDCGVDGNDPFFSRALLYRILIALLPSSATKEGTLERGLLFTSGISYFENKVAYFNAAEVVEVITFINGMRVENQAEGDTPGLRYTLKRLGYIEFAFYVQNYKKELKIPEGIHPYQRGILKYDLVARHVKSTHEQRDDKKAEQKWVAARANYKGPYQKWLVVENAQRRAERKQYKIPEEEHKEHDGEEHKKHYGDELYHKRARQEEEEYQDKIRKMIVLWNTDPSEYYRLKKELRGGGHADKKLFNDCAYCPGEDMNLSDEENEAVLQRYAKYHQDIHAF